MARVSFALDPKKLLKIQALIITYLIVMSFLTRAGRSFSTTLYHLFDLNRETNFPSFYSSMGLLLSAVLLICIGRWKKGVGDGFHRHWTWLGYVFILMSLDEMISVHEWVSQLIAAHSDVQQTTWLRYPWVIPGLAFVAVIVVLYARMLLALPRRLSVSMVAAGAVFVAGAVGMEMIEAAYDSTAGRSGSLFWLMTQVEESMEMYSIAAFNAILLSYLAEHVPALELDLRPVASEQR